MSSIAYEFSEFRLDPGRRTLLDPDGGSVTVTAKAFDALVYLVEHHGELVDRAALRDYLWPSAIVEDNNLNQAIGALRRVLGDGFIATVPGRGYQFVAEVRVLDDSNERPETGGIAAPERQARLRLRSAWSLAPLAAGAFVLTVAGFVYLRSQQSAFGPTVDVSAALGAPREIEPNALAVLPFADLSPGRDQAYLADGLADELINQLGAIEPLRVTARTSSFAFRGTDASVTAIGRALGVAHMLEGSIVTDGETLRVRARLIDTGTGYNVWSETYERRLVDILAVQEEIAAAVAEELRGPLAVDEQPRARAGTRDADAYAFYLAGRANTVLLVDSVERGLEQIDAALAIDPEFALGWTQKALLHEYRHLMRDVRDSADLRESQSAAERAIELDPTLDIAHTLIASARAHRGDFIEAEAQYREMLGERPRASGRHGILMLAVGHVEQARKELAEAVELDPLSKVTSAFLAAAHDSLGYTGQALDEFARARRLFPIRVTGVFNEVITRIGIGEIESINELREIYPNDKPTWDLLEQTFVSFAQTPEQTAAMIRAGSLTELGPLYRRGAAALAARLDQPELALEIFAPTLRETSALQSHVLWRPAFRSVRRLPAFKQLMRDEGFLDYWLVYGWPDFCRPLVDDDFECF